MSTHMPFDIQLQIIGRLPIKSLFQFRSVCKVWKSFIDSCHFIAGYNDRHDLPQHLVVRYEVGRYEQEIEVKYVSFVDDDDDSFPQQKFTLTVPPIPQAKATTIIDSSHGLLCLIGYCREADGIAILWNPSIRKSIAVALPDVVDESFNISVIGFGVCPDTKDPKLVKITNIDESDSISCQVMVFTLSSREWRCLCSSNLPRKQIEFKYDQTTIGQFIYLLAYDWISVDRYCNLIMSFEMSTEEFREIDLPDSLSDMCKSPALSISRLRESLVVVEDLTWNSGSVVWMMDHSKAFTKIYTINIPNASIWSILGFRKSGEPIVEILTDHKDHDSAIVVYEPCSEQIKDLGIHGKRFSFCGNFYTESLLLHDRDDGHIIKCGAVNR